MKEVLLYTTSGCHLCEKAKELLWPFLSEYSFHLKEIEISDDLALVERYGVRIPVLFRNDIDAELGWPFDNELIVNFLNQ